MSTKKEYKIIPLSNIFTDNSNDKYFYLTTDASGDTNNTDQLHIFIEKRNGVVNCWVTSIRPVDLGPSHQSTHAPDAQLMSHADLLALVDKFKPGVGHLLTEDLTKSLF